MRRFILVTMTVLAVTVGGVGFSDNAQSQLNSPLGDDTDAMELRSIVVEGWEGAPWLVDANPGPPESTVEVNTVEGRPSNLAFDERNKRSLGLRFQFIYPGNNMIVLKPTEDRRVRRYIGQLDADNRPKFVEVPGIELPGKVKAISIWVLGRGAKYALEGWVEDWKGDTHIFKFGMVDFIGWRPMTVNIPEGVPQGVDSYPQTKTLVFKKFVIRSLPTSNQEKVVLFMDSLKVLTTLYDVYFDGMDVNFDPVDRQEKERIKRYAEQLLSGEAAPAAEEEEPAAADQQPPAQ